MRQRSPWMLVLMAALQMGWGSGVAHADPIVVDQAFLPSRPDLHAGLRLDIDAAQTFTVGRSGRLSRIDLFVTTTFPVMVGSQVPFELRPTVGGVPVDDDSSAFARTFATLQTHDRTQPGAIVSIPLDAFDLNVRRGDVLAIVLRSTGTQGTLAEWWGNSIGGYAPGQAFTRAPSLDLPAFMTPGGSNSRADFGFRTFVEPAPVPEPATGLLLASGAAMLIKRARRRLRNNPH